MGLNIFSVIAILGVIQGIFLGIVVLTKRRKRRAANVFLSLLIFSISITLIHAVLFISKYYFEFPHLIGFANPLPFLFGGLLYLHVKAFSRKEYVFRKTDLLNFFPFIICLGYMTGFYIKPPEYKL